MSVIVDFYLLYHINNGNTIRFLRIEKHFQSVNITKYLKFINTGLSQVDNYNLRQPRAFKFPIGFNRINNPDLTFNFQVFFNQFYVFAVFFTT